MNIRECTAADLPYLYDICWKTALNGQPVDRIMEDRFKPGHYYAAPYLHFDRECCFVAEVGGMPRGYIIGTADTEAYTRWLNREWLPQVRKTCAFSCEKELHPFEKHLDECLSGDTVPDPDLASWEAHLHIDLLPELQGKGMGRKLMETFFRRCREKGASGVHLGVASENRAALAFYRKMGMKEIKAVEGAFMLGYKL